MTQILCLSVSTLRLSPCPPAFQPTLLLVSSSIVSVNVLPSSFCLFGSSFPLPNPLSSSLVSSLKVTGIFRAIPMRVNPRKRTVKAIYRTYIDVIHLRKVRALTMGEATRLSVCPAISQEWWWCIYRQWSFVGTPCWKTYVTNPRGNHLPRSIIATLLSSQARDGQMSAEDPKAELDSEYHTEFDVSRTRHARNNEWMGCSCCVRIVHLFSAPYEPVHLLLLTLLPLSALATR